MNKIQKELLCLCKNLLSKDIIVNDWEKSDTTCYCNHLFFVEKEEKIHSNFNLYVEQRTSLIGYILAKVWSVSLRNLENDEICYVECDLSNKNIGKECENIFTKVIKELYEKVDKKCNEKVRTKLREDKKEALAFLEEINEGEK